MCSQCLILSDLFICWPHFVSNWRDSHASAQNAYPKTLLHHYSPWIVCFFVLNLCPFGYSRNVCTPCLSVSVFFGVAILCLVIVISARQTNQVKSLIHISQLFRYWTNEHLERSTKIWFDVILLSTKQFFFSPNMHIRLEFNLMLLLLFSASM